jgi:excisionase family DNA binding protein
MENAATDAPPESRLAYSVDEVTRISGLGRSTVYEAIGAGHLIARKAGRRTVILAVDLNRWLDNLPMMEAVDATAA